MYGKKKYRIRLRLYFSAVTIITLCFACILSALLAVGGMLLFYHGDFTLPVVMSLCLVVCFMTMLIGGIALYFGTSYFVKPLEEISKVVRQIAKGNFDVNIERNDCLRKNAEYAHELDELKANINLMAAELSGVDHMRKDFVSNVSHEMKTPVSSMMGFTEMLMDDDLPYEEQREYLRLIHDEAARASRLCENMLRMSRLENQALVTNHERVLVDEQIRKCVIVLSEKYPDSEREYDIDLPKMYIQSDPDLLQQVWINLIDNAVKYSGEDTVIHIYGKKEADGILVSVRDEGIGIAKEKQPHIFEAFYQCEESHKTVGNGLGLSIVKKIVELLGGGIECISTEGAGTEMRVKLYENRT